MIILGIVLAVVGLLLGLNVLVIIGVVLAVAGALLAVTHTNGPVRGRWY